MGPDQPHPRNSTPHDADACTDELASVYEQLRATARHQLSRERDEHTLQPTALVHEVWLRLAPDTGDADERRRFLCSAATAMRHVLIDHARARLAAKRGGDAIRLGLEEQEAGETPALAAPDVLAIDEALTRLARFAETPARIVELKFFAGMSHLEIAQALGTSESTVERSWRLARAWLRRELEEYGS